jgi:hypothetical protein
MSEKSFVQEQQLTTKDLIIRFIGVIRQLTKEWRLLMIGACIGGLLSIAYDLKEYREKLYWGIIQFNLENGSSNSLGSLASMASAFGMQTGGGGSDLFSGINFNVILQSRALYDRAFMKEVTVNGKKILFVNYYKDSCGIAQREWAGNFFKSPNTEAIKYKFAKKDPKDITPYENLIIQALYEKLSASTFLTSTDKGSSIMTLKASSISENLSKAWVEILLKTLEEYYVEIKTQKTREVLEIQEKRLAELSSKLSNTDKQVANANYQAINAVDPLAPMRTAQVSRNNQYIAQQYYTQYTTVENLKLMLINQTPFFMIVEPVRLPLTTTNSTVGESLFPGAILGLILLSIFILFRNTLRNVMASVKEN